MATISKRSNRDYVRHLETIEKLLEEGGGGGGTPNAVKYTEQSLTSAQQQQARENIGSASTSALSQKQDTLVSGTNIKTLNNQSLLGSGNITIDDQSAVKYTEAQSLTDAQKSTARLNIAAASLSDINNTEYVKAAIRPEASASTIGPIYLIGPDANDEYERYVTQESDGTYSWVALGSTEIHIDGYATEAEVSQLEAEKADKGDFSYDVVSKGASAFELQGWFSTSDTKESNFRTNSAFLSHVFTGLNPGDKIGYDVRVNTNLNRFTAINADGDIIDHDVSSTGLSFQTGYYTVPNGAVKVYLTVLNNNDYVADQTYWLHYDLKDDVEKCVSTNPQTFTDAEKQQARQNIGAISEAETGYFWNTLIGSAAFTIDGFYSTSGVWTVNVSFKTARINVNPGDKVRYLLKPIAAIWGVVALAPDGTTIVDHLQISGTNATGEYTVPAGTKYLVLTTHKDNLATSSYSVRISLSEFYDETVKLFDGAPIVVRQTDTQPGEFSTIAAAIAVAKEFDTIHIYPGTYSENHIILPRGIKLIGIGDKADIIIAGDLGANCAVADNREYSTLEAYKGCTLENLTVTAKNMRYPVHQDAGDGNNRWIVKNCHFIHYGNEEAYNYQVSLGESGQPSQIWNANSAWGGGLHGGDYVECMDCIFESVGRGFSEHDNNGTDFDDYGAAIVRLVNCDLISKGRDKDGTLSELLASLFVQSFPSQKKNEIILSNCRVNGYVVTTSLQSLSLKMYGCGNNKLTWSYYGTGGASIYGSENNISRNLVATSYFPKDDNTNSYVNRGTDTIAKGAPVKELNGGVALASTGDKLFGIALQEILVGEVGQCVTGGFVSRVYPLGIRDNTYWVGASPTYPVLKNIGDPVYLGNGRFTFTETGVPVMRVTDNQNLEFV